MDHHQTTQRSCSGGGLGAIGAVFVLFAAPAFLATFLPVLLLGLAIHLGISLGRMTSRL